MKEYVLTEDHHLSVIPHISNLHQLWTQCLGPIVFKCDGSADSSASGPLNQSHIIFTQTLSTASRLDPVSHSECGLYRSRLKCPKLYPCPSKTPLWIECFAWNGDKVRKVTVFCLKISLWTRIPNYLSIDSDWNTWSEARCRHCATTSGHIFLFFSSFSFCPNAVVVFWDRVSLWPGYGKHNPEEYSLLHSNTQLRSFLFKQAFSFFS